MRVKNLFSKPLIIVLLTSILFNPLFGEKKSAGKAMLLCIIPGGGQFYTERYVPGILIGGGEITLGYLAYKKHLEKNYSERNSLLWWELFVFGYSLADAYVGAKMYNFDLECDIDRVSLLYRIKF
jgi:hypothetical protein